MIARPSLTIGIEEEYQIIDPETRELRSFITQFIENDRVIMVEREIKPELHQSMVELGTPPCATVAQAHEELVKQRTFIARLAREKDLAIMCSGTHPFSRWIDQQVTPFPRYLGVLEEMQLLAQRLLIFGMHVHVGVEDRAFAIDTMNVVRYMLPHILALSTSSPFWLGRRTGLKSYRSVVFEDFPRSGIPDICRTAADYDNMVGTLVRAGCIPDASKIWWDVRPHPFFPTLEYRVCDICPRVDDTIAIAALIQATTAKLYKLYKQNLGFRIYHRALIQENKWRAIRYGLDGKLLDLGKQKEVPVKDLIRELLDFVDDVVDELGSRREIEHIHTILERGTSADEQLRVYEESGHDFNAVVDMLIKNTMENVPEKCFD